MGGNAQGGDLQIMYDGGRIQNPRSSYDPMRKQGAILLGNGGDNSNGSSGTFYEGAMTAPGTFPTIETNQAVQANVVAAGYDVAMLSISASNKVDKPNLLQTFAPKTTQNVTVTFTNTFNQPIEDLEISLVTPRGWKSVVAGGKGKVRKIGYTIEAGQTVAVQFAVTSPKKLFNGDLMAKASWNNGSGQWTTAQKVRNVEPVKINEFRIADGSGNQTNSFIELYNAGEKAVNLSGWTLTHHAVNLPYFSSINIPKGTKLAPKSFYVMGISNSGLSVDAAKGDNVIYVRKFIVPIREFVGCFYLKLRDYMYMNRHIFSSHRDHPGGGDFDIRKLMSSFVSKSIEKELQMMNSHTGDLGHWPLIRIR